MRLLLASVAAFGVFLCCQIVWSQDFGPLGSVDPFGGAEPKASQHQITPNHSSSNESSKEAPVKRARKAIDEGRRPVHVATSKQRQAEKRIQSAMNDETSVLFIETPLEEALQQLSQMHKIPILADRRALEEIGLTPDTPVTLDLKNVSLRSALRLMLGELDLTYMIKDEVMQVTTIEAAEHNLILEMYVLPDNLAGKSDQVVAAMQDAVVSGTWAASGGPSTATTVDHVLVVSTTSDVHHEIETFLAKLISHYGK